VKAGSYKSNKSLSIGTVTRIGVVAVRRKPSGVAKYQPAAHVADDEADTMPLVA
jgi:hypothetical protein